MSDNKKACKILAVGLCGMSLLDFAISSIYYSHSLFVELNPIVTDLGSLVWIKALTLLIGSLVIVKYGYKAPLLLLGAVLAYAVVIVRSIQWIMAMGGLW